MELPTATDMLFSPSDRDAALRTCVEGDAEVSLDRLYVEHVDAITSRHVEEYSTRENSDVEKVHSLVDHHLREMGDKIHQIDRMFDGATVTARTAGSHIFLEGRKAFAIKLFQEVVRPRIQEILHAHGVEKDFDECVCVIGFNRLFMGNIGSSATDIDFNMFVDVEDQAILCDIRRFFHTVIQPELVQAGIDLEIEDRFIMRMQDHLHGLGDTRKALFTLANKGNVEVIVGSHRLKKQAFHMTNEQIASHFAALLVKHDDLDEDSVQPFKERLIRQLEESLDFRKRVVRELRVLSNSELYIGKNPYEGKKTIQTIMGEAVQDQRYRRELPFSIKFCLNRIVDLIRAGKYKFKECLGITIEKMQKIEVLATVLSNMKCRMDAAKKGHHSLISIQHHYSEVTLEDLEKMNPKDKSVVDELLADLQPVDRHDKEHFPRECYDALWRLADKIYQVATHLEEKFYREAVQLVHA